MDPLARIESRLRDVIGLDAGTIGRHAVMAAVRACMRAAAVHDLAAYAGSLDHRAELDRLIEMVAVPESYFFRDAGSLDYLKAFVRDEWRGELLRILSVPCAAGEEPYSIAMTLLEGGMPPSRFRIEAVDVRAGAIAAAERGHYRPSAFRGQAAFEARERWFKAEHHGFTLAAAPRESVRFTRGNLLDPLLLAGQTFDVVFCKNLLIYFDEEARRRALANFERLLAADGRLLAGASEIVWLHGAGPFAPCGGAGAMALRRAADRRASARTQPAPASANRPPSRPPAPRVETAARGGAPRPPEPPTLVDARRLAGMGRIADARLMVNEWLQTHAPSDETFSLLGLLAYAEGDDGEGQRMMDRALYLNPENVEALTFLALHRERQGDRAGAALLRDRVRRAETARIGEAS